jgi:hypothetical protein
MSIIAVTHKGKWKFMLFYSYIAQKVTLTEVLCYSDMTTNKFRNLY